MISLISSVVSASFLGCLPETVQDRLCHLAIPTELPAGQVLFDPELTIVIDGRLRALQAGTGGATPRSPFWPSNPFRLRALQAGTGGATAHRVVHADAKRLGYCPGGGSLHLKKGSYVRDEEL